MTDFPSNRHKDKQEEPDTPKAEKTDKKVEKVVEGEAIRRKKSLGTRLKETFFGGDTRGVWGFVGEEVLIPAAKDMIADAVSQGIERMIYGEAQSSSRRTGRRPDGKGPYISYNRYSGSRKKGPSRRNEISHRARAAHNFDEIILPTRVEADEVIDRLFDLVSKYESATVADLYDLVGITGNYTDDKWGWFDLRGADVRRVRHGYLLDLPKPEPLD